MDEEIDYNLYWLNVLKKEYIASIIDHTPVRRRKVYEVLKKANARKWDIFDNKHIINYAFGHWIDEIEGIYGK